MPEMSKTSFSYTVLLNELESIATPSQLYSEQDRGYDFDMPGAGATKIKYLALNFLVC